MEIAYSAPLLPARTSWAYQLIPLRAIESLVITAGAIVVSLGLFGLFVAISGYDAVAMYSNIWAGSFGKWFNVQSSLTRAAPLLLTGLCAALPLRLGLVIIGGEGALVLGAVAAAVVGHAMAGSPALASLLSMTVAAGLA